MKICKENIQITLQSDHERQMFIDILECARLNMDDYLSRGYAYSMKNEMAQLEVREMLSALLEI